MRICLYCDKPARESRRLCRTCETNKYMEKYYDDQKEFFGHDHSTLSKLMLEYIDYLDTAFGEHKREKAQKLKYTYQAFLNGEIMVKDAWTTEDIQYIEQLRQNKSVPVKVALYHLKRFLSNKYELKMDLDELRIVEVINEIPVSYQKIIIDYNNFLRDKRKLKHWTRFQLAYSYKYFFTYIEQTYQMNNLSQISSEPILNDLIKLKDETSQKNVYIRSKELLWLFKWAKQTKKVFTNPVEGLDVSYFYEMTNRIHDNKQKELLERWMDQHTHPRVALIGILSLIYACSVEELRYLKCNDFDFPYLQIMNRTQKIKLPNRLSVIVERYVNWREQLVNKTNCEYFIVSTQSFKLNEPVSHRMFYQDLKPYDVNNRQLRATRLIDISLSGNVKVLEGLGLSYEGIRPYINFANPTLLLP